MGNRIYYAIQQVGIKSVNDADFTAIHGLQSVNTNNVINNIPISQFGNIPIYDIIENGHDINLSITKVLDGYPLIYTLATSNSSTPLLEDKMVQRCSVAMSIFDDSKISAIGTPLATVQYSGIFISSFRYIFNTTTNFTEEVSFVGNNKIWSKDTKIINTDDKIVSDNLSFDGVFNNTDSPLSSAGVNRRQDLIFNGSAGNTTILPTDIAGISKAGQPSGAHVVSINISANINRESLFSQGNISPYFRLPTFPIEITTEFTIIAVNNDAISLSDGGILSSNTSCDYKGNIDKQTINIATCEGTRINLGNNNKLSAVSYQGGDAAGGHATISYTYKTYDMCTILHQMDTSVNGTDTWTNMVGWMSVDNRVHGVSQALWGNF